MQDEAWESSDAVRLSILLPGDVAERLADEASRREISSRDLAEQLVRRGLADLADDDAPNV
jgi:hypothetical protein